MKETVGKKKETRVAGAQTWSSDVCAYWAQVKVVVPAIWGVLPRFGEVAGRELSKGLTRCALP